METEKVVIIGSGKIGAAIVKLLHHSSDYDVFVVDHDPDSLKLLRPDGGPGNDPKNSGNC